MVKQAALESETTRHSTRHIAFGALFACILVSWSWAEDRSYVLQDGRKVRLIRSETELGIQFQSSEDAVAGKRRLEQSQLGIVVDVQSAPGSSLKILRTARVSPNHKGLILRDPAVADVGAVYRVEGGNEPVIGTGSIVTKVRSDLTPDERTQLWSELSAAAVEPLKGLHDVYVLQFAADDDEVLIAEQLAGDSRVLWANPNFRRTWRPMQTAPADPFYPQQWHLNNTGQVLGSKVGADIDAPEAWAIATGKGILVGLFDTGCDVDHEDLKDNYIGTGQDATLPPINADYSNPRPKIASDIHSTAVVGLIVAAANNIGVRGVAFGAKFTASRGLEDFIDDTGIASAFTFALEKKVDVHNNSWGPITTDFPAAPVILDAIKTAFHDGRDPDGDGPLPPRGMPIFFSSGNDGRELVPSADFAALPEVIAVGASTVDDKVSFYSNFGDALDFLAPSGDYNKANVATTDVTDTAGFPTKGLNIGGLPNLLFLPSSFGVDIDATGSYTKFFGGTSAACPIATGIGALILSTNPNLTATDVRLIMEHTCDQINPTEAAYDVITGKSFKYGHGRLNAHRAVVAASDSLGNGGLAWPDVPASVTADGTTLQWKATAGASEYLVLELDGVLDSPIQDGACYDAGQSGCSSTALDVLPANVIPHLVACAAGACTPGSDETFTIGLPSVGTKNFAVYARNSVGKYSFGAKIEIAAISPPAVTIDVSPLQGVSPLRVTFNGNATSAGTIDESRTSWDFDISDGIGADATTRATSHVYSVASGDTQTFFARLTMYDTEGRSGFAQVGITVSSPDQTGGGDVGSGNLQIVVSLPNSAGSNVGAGDSPFSVLLSVDASGATGTLQSVIWDLGDGGSASSIVVQHTYTNTGDTDLRIPITATVTMATAAQTIATFTATRVITVHPGTAPTNPGTPHLPGTTPGGAGGAATPCSGLGMLPMFVMLLSLVGMRGRVRLRRNR